MIDFWRKSWSVTPGTTDPMAPFGVVTLASGGSEGGNDIGGMRWSQVCLRCSWVTLEKRNESTEPTTFSLGTCVLWLGNLLNAAERFLIC